MHESMEVALDRAQVIELLSHSAAAIREDLALMESGTIKVAVFGADVTHDQAGRMKVNLTRLEAILEAYGAELPEHRHGAVFR